MHGHTTMDSRIEMRQIPKTDDNRKLEKTLWNTVDVNVFAVLKKKEKPTAEFKGEALRSS